MSPTQLAEVVPWRSLAACKQHSEVNFFPESFESALPAINVCKGCPVQQDCLDYALDHCIDHGIFGGISARKRREMRRVRRRAS